MIAHGVAAGLHRLGSCPMALAPRPSHYEYLLASDHHLHIFATANRRSISHDR